MKAAKEWCEEMFSRGNWVVADEVTIEAIQEDALKHAQKLLKQGECICTHCGLRNSNPDKQGPTF